VVGLSLKHNTIIGTITVACFLCCYFYAINIQSWKECLYASVLLLSPAVVLGLERANIDLIIFIFLVVTCRVICVKSRPAQILAYGLLYLISILKFYGFIAYSVYLLICKSRFSFIKVAGLTIVLAVLFLWLTLSDYADFSMPDPSGNWTFGAKMIFWFGGTNLLSSNSLISGVSAGVWFLIFLLVIFKRGGSVDVSKNSSEFERILFVAGSSIGLEAFVLMSNYDYRCVFLLICVPYLWRLRYLKVAYARIALILLLPVLWYQTVISLSYSLHSMGILSPSMVNWFIWAEQPITWLLMINILLAWAELLRDLMFRQLNVPAVFNQRWHFTRVTR